jgi:dual specificity protein phosphatase-like protein
MQPFKPRPGQVALDAIAPPKPLATAKEPYAGQKYSEISCLDRFVFVGDYLDGRNRALHMDHDITAIVNCTNEPHPHDDIPMLCLEQADYVGVDWEKLDQFFAFMDEHISAGGTVLIHCALGVNRAPTFATAWVMRERRWTWDRAIAYVRWRRKIANPDVAQTAVVTAYMADRYPALILVDDGQR